MADFTVQVLNVSQVSFESSCSHSLKSVCYLLLNLLTNFRAGSSAYSGLYVTQDLMDFLNANSSECSVVLFFTAWCQFSARLAPHFNALPRVFPSMHFLALDASQHSRWLVCVCVRVCVKAPLLQWSCRNRSLSLINHSLRHHISNVLSKKVEFFFLYLSLSTRFGTVAVPNILLFQGAKPMARFNHTDRTLEMLSSFITNQTGVHLEK